MQILLQCLYYFSTKDLQYFYINILVKTKTWMFPIEIFTEI